MANLSPATALLALILGLVLALGLVVTVGLLTFRLLVWLANVGVIAAKTSGRAVAGHGRKVTWSPADGFSEVPELGGRR